MQPGPQVLVKFKTGEKVVFEIQGHDDFVRLVNEVSTWWGLWLFIGQNAAVRKNDIDGMYYLAEGYAQNSQSNMPPV